MAEELLQIFLQIQISKVINYLTL